MSAFWETAIKFHENLGGKLEGRRAGSCQRSCFGPAFCRWHRLDLEQMRFPRGEGARRWGTASAPSGPKPSPAGCVTGCRCRLEHLLPVQRTKPALLRGRDGSRQMKA